MTTASVVIVVKMDASAVEADIINMITIWSRAACWTEEPPRIAPERI